MGRLFLSAQTTCALLLGAGLLLRAQAHLRAQEENAPQMAARTRPAQVFDMRGAPGRVGQPPRVVRAPSNQERTATRGGKARTQGRKPTAHRAARKAGRRGSAVAESNTGEDGGRR